MIDSELAAGFGIALLAAIAYDSGYALQAFEARRAPIEQSMRPGLLAHLVRRPIWLAAIGLAIVGWALQVLALTKAPLTLVQPVLALGLFLLLGLGVRFLGEHVGRREWAAVGDHRRRGRADRLGRADRAGHRPPRRRPRGGARAARRAHDRPGRREPARDAAGVRC